MKYIHLCPTHAHALDKSGELKAEYIKDCTSCFGESDVDLYADPHLTREYFAKKYEKQIKSKNLADQ